MSYMPYVHELEAFGVKHYNVGSITDNFDFAAVGTQYWRVFRAPDLRRLADNVCSGTSAEFGHARQIHIKRRWFVW